MKCPNQRFNTFLTVILSLLIITVSLKSAHAHKTNDLFTFKSDLNHLISNTQLVTEIKTHKALSRNRIATKKTSEKNKKREGNNIKIPHLASPTTNFKYDSSKTYHSVIKPFSQVSIQHKAAFFQLIQNKYCGITENVDSYTTQISSLDTKQNTSETILKKLLKPAKSSTQIAKHSNQKDSKADYWDTLHFIESSSGKRLYRKRNKARSCKWTTTPCGHHQLSVVALKDIGCKTLKCRSARENYDTSLSMSKKLEQINVERMKKKGYKTLPDYQRYLVHQQGATGLGIILDASKGKKKLSKKTIKYMANNSPYSFKQLRRAGNRGAARKFLNHWEEKWKVNHSRRIASR